MPSDRASQERIVELEAALQQSEMRYQAVVDTALAGIGITDPEEKRLKGAQTIVTGISDAVAETIVDLGIDWGGLETLADLQTGLRVALAKVRLRIVGG